MQAEMLLTDEVYQIVMTSDLDSYFRWLEDNAFWNSQLLEVRYSSFAGGKGVFWKNPVDLDASFASSILLRVPKSNILSSKNSLVYNLLIDYSEMSSGDSDIDLSRGIHSLIICFIYELSMGQASPWYEYLKAIDPHNSPIGVPLCLWEEKERNLLYNTECYYSDMMNLDELVLLFEECIKFAEANAKYVEVPEIFRVSLATKEEAEFGRYKDNLKWFGMCVQSVISRAFQVDDYHGPSLVPGADLFNHISPEADGGVVKGRENVEFVCDGGENVCEICGEQECDHEDEADEMIEGLEEVIGNGGSDSADDDNDEDDDSDDDSEDDNDDSEEDGDDNDSNTDLEEDITEITMDFIEQIEREQGLDEDQELDDEEEDNLSDGEESGNESFIKIPFGDELEAQLLDSSQCVDIVMVLLPRKEHDYELFITYGNDLSNPYLLQRYLFVVPKNPNDHCTMNVYMKEYIKQQKSKVGRGQLRQLEQKLEWLESWFEVICEVINDYSRLVADIERDESSDTDEEDDENDEGDFEGEYPDSWESSVKISSNGKFSIHTYLIFQLLQMPYSEFKSKLLKVNKPQKLATRVSKLLLVSGAQELDDKAQKVATGWITKRLEGYKKLPEPQNEREYIIHQVVALEKSILQAALAQL